VTRSLARRLRQYVAQGGRVGLMGTGSLRSGVQLAEDRLTRPTPAGPADAFGQRVADPRTLDRPAGDPGPSLVTLTDDPPQLPVFTAFDGQFEHRFEEVEELLDAGRGEVVAAIGEALSEAELAEAEAAARAGRGRRSRRWRWARATCFAPGCRRGWSASRRATPR
jgi:hypothetical protein